MAIPQSEILKFAKDEDDTVNKNMQSKFNTFVEFVLSSGISMPEAADDFEVVSLDMDEPSENEADIVISAGISEGEIADDIIKEVKKLRKKVGDDSYYRASKILKLAEKLKEMHPTKVSQESYEPEIEGWAGNPDEEDHHIGQNMDGKLETLVGKYVSVRSMGVNITGVLSKGENGEFQIRRNNKVNISFSGMIVDRITKWKGMPSIVIK